MVEAFLSERSKKGLGLLRHLLTNCFAARTMQGEESPHRYLPLEGARAVHLRADY